MRVVKTQGRGGKQTRQMLRELELRGARNTARAMPVVQRIVGDVRKGGDRALRRYAAKLDGLTPQMPLEISRAEMEQAWDATPKPLQAAMQTAAGNIRRFAARQMPKAMDRNRGRAHDRTTSACFGSSRVLCAERPLPIALYPADDGDSGAGGGGATDCGGVA